MAIIAASPPLVFVLLNFLPTHWRWAILALVFVPLLMLLGWYGYGRLTGRIPPPKLRIDFRDTEAKSATQNSNSAT
jgi:hypothetical protein